MCEGRGHAQAHPVKGPQGKKRRSSQSADGSPRGRESLEERASRGGEKELGKLSLRRREMHSEEGGGEGSEATGSPDRQGCGAWNR